MTERTIQNSLWTFLQRKGHELICPCYTPLHWWECDMFSLTGASRMVEHEIKLTVEDFRADAKKQTEHYVIENGRHARDADGQLLRHIRFKHQQLGLGDPRGPSKFWYVMPENLVPLEQVPVFAGVRWIRPNGTIDMLAAREAPALHREKVDPKVVEHARSVFYYRYWTERCRRKESPRP